MFTEVQDILFPTSQSTSESHIKPVDLKLPKKKKVTQSTSNTTAYQIKAQSNLDTKGVAVSNVNFHLNEIGAPDTGSSEKTKQS